LNPAGVSHRRERQPFGPYQILLLHGAGAN
jgi:hypothetical protein